MSTFWKSTGFLKFLQGVLAKLISERKDGAYGAGCRAFYRCTGQKAYFVECKQPYVYSKNTQKCEK